MLMWQCITIIQQGSGERSMKCHANVVCHTAEGGLQTVDSTLAAQGGRESLP